MTTKKCILCGTRRPDHAAYWEARRSLDEIDAIASAIHGVLEHGNSFPRREELPHGLRVLHGHVENVLEKLKILAQ